MICVHWSRKCILSTPIMNEMFYKYQLSLFDLMCHSRLFVLIWIDSFEGIKLMLLNCGIEEDSWSPLDCNEIKPVNPKGNQPWIFIGRTDAEAPIFWPPDMKNWLIWKDPGSGKDWRQEKGMTGWDGWMASLTQWTWVWVRSGSWWWTGRPGVLLSMGFQRVEHDWVTELNWNLSFFICMML